MSSDRSSLNKLNNPFRQLSSVNPLTSPARTDDALATARRIGTFTSSSDPVTFRHKNKLNKTDRTDFLRIDLAAGASFSSTQNRITVKGGNISVTTFLALPGAPLQRVDISKFGNGSKTEESNTPFSNVFGATAQLYFRIRIRRPRNVKKIDYKIDLTFTP